MEQSSNRYKYFVLVVLSGMYCFSVIDRQILVILQESIKKDLHLSDASLGLLSGFTFGIFYTVMGIPIARLADKLNRKNIISVSLVLWSIMTAFCGISKSFSQLFFARIGVGVGEAGSNPSAYSLIADLFPKEKRASALSIYGAGSFVGVILGFLLGGWLNHLYGWRIAFLCLGIPGVLYAIFLYRFIKEPIRGNFDTEEEKQPVTYTFIQGLKHLFSNKSYVYLCLAYGMILFTFYGTNNWMPSLLSRLHGMNSAQIGTLLAMIVGVSGLVGTLIGGRLTDKFIVNDIKYYLWLPAIANGISLPFLLVMFFSNNATLVLLAFIIPSALNCMFLVSAVALIHRLVNVNIRAFAASVYLCISNLLGVSLAPFAVGRISDLLAPKFGIYSLRWALLLTFGATILAILFLLKSSKYVISDLNKKIYAG